jgi:diacylglycerol O-acyltransferase
MLTSYPQVPTGYELGVGIAAQSYDGKVFFGFTSDTHAAPDAGLLRNCVRDCFEELCRAAGLRKSKPRKPRVRKPAAAQASPAPPEVIGAVEALSPEPVMAMAAEPGA